MPVTETVGGVVNALKEQPATFALICFAGLLLGYTWYTSANFQTAQLQMSKLMLEHQNETQQILSRCIEPAQVQTIIDQLGRDRQAYTDQLRANINQSQGNAQALEQILELLKKQRGGALEHAPEQHGETLQPIEDGHGG